MGSPGAARSPSRPQAVARLRAAGRERLWPVAAAYAAVVVPLVLRASHGRYVGDNRFDLYWNPARRVSRTFALWDGSRGLGRVREDLWPGPTAPVALFRALGASPWLAEALFHSLLLVLLGTGVVALLRLYRPDIGAAHVLAGALAICSPYAAGFLLPSQLFLHVALAPWLAYVVHRGVHSHEPWRWAAAFALIVFAFGNTDPPGAVYATLPAVVVLLSAVAVERTVALRTAVGWLVRAGVLSMLVAFAALAKLGLAAATFAQRLNDTETPETAALTSSWAESWRGLGFWLLYFRDAAGVARPQAAWYFSGALPVLVTFVPPLAAVATVWTSRWRPRLVFAAMALISLVIMVGGFPLDDPPPIGAAILETYRKVPGLAAFRNSYKAGAGLVIGISVLFGVGVDALGDRLARLGRAARPAVLSGAALLLVAIAHPLVAGDLYDPATTMDEVPDHWVDALRWLDEEDQSSGRILVLPGTTRADYRWGWPGDDLFDALLARDHAIDTSIPLSTPRAAELLHATSELVGDEYRAGTMAPILRRLGIDTVVLRNDLRWEEGDLPRPASLDSLRDDRDLTLVATFGEPGTFTTDPADRSGTAGRELRLPPVEVYRVRDPARVRGVASAPPLVVSGNGVAWGPMAVDGLLDDGRAVRYSADLAPDVATSLLGDGSRLVLTDTNRRAMEIVVGFVAESSHIVAEGQDLDRASSDLFGVAGSQSVASFADATAISASGKARTIIGFEPWYRPANAFDGLPATAWQVRIAERPAGRWLRVELSEPQEIDAIELADTAAGERGAHVAAVALHFSDGSRERIDLVEGRASASFRARTTSWVEVEVLGIVGGGSGTGSVGFSEISFPGLDLAEYVRIPDDLRRAADGDEALRAALEAAPLSIQLDREDGDGPVPVEAALRREVWVAGDRSMTLTGVARLDDAVPDAVIADLVPTPVRAVGNRRHRGDIAGAGVLAVDGDLSTAWIAPAESAPTLELELPTGVAALEVVADASAASSPVTEVVLERGEAVERATLERSDGCNPASVGVAAACTTTGVVAVPGGEGPLVLRVTGLERRPGEGLLARPVAIAELRPDGEALPPLDRSAALDGCSDGVLLIDGDDVALRFEGTVDDLLLGRAVPFEACAPVALADGWHRIDGAPAGTAIDRVRLRDGDDVPVTAAVPSVTVVRRGPAFLDLRIDAPDGGTVTTGESWDPGWIASLDGVPLGPAEPINTLNGWEVPPADGALLHVTYQSQRRFDRSLAVTLLGLAVCLGLLGRPRRDLELVVAAEGAPVVRLGQTAQALALVVAIGFGAAVAATSGAVVAGAAVVAGLLSPRGKAKPAALGALVFLLVAALATVLGGPLGEDAVRIDFASRRTLAAETGAVAGVLLLVAVLLGAIEERAVEARARVAPARPRLAHRLRRVREVVVEHLPAIATTALAFVVRVALAPGALAPSAAPLFADIDLGIGYRAQDAAGALGPLPATLAAFSPFAPDLTLVLLSTAVVAAAAALAGRTGGRRASWLAGLAVAVLPIGWGIRLPEVLAALLALLAVRSARSGAPRRALASGALAGAAALCRPEAALVVVAVVLVGRAHFGVRWGRAAAAGAALLVLPWLRWLVVDQGLGPALAPSDSVPGALLVLATQALLVAIAGAQVLRRRRPAWSVPVLGCLVVLVAADVLTGGGRGISVWAAPLVAVWVAVVAGEAARGADAAR